MGLYTTEGKITFSITSKCNLDCIYCYSNKHSHKPQTLLLDFAKVGIDDFFDSSTSRRIRFFGSGEPTTEFQLLKDITLYCKEKAGDKLQAEIQTNGVFSDQIAAWIADNISTVYVSTDGEKFVQNYYRPSKGGKDTADIVSKNIKFLVKNGKGKLAVRSTIGNANLYRQRELLTYFSDLGVKYVWTRPIFPPPIGEQKGKDEIISLSEYAEEFVKAQSYAKELNIFLGSFMSCNFDVQHRHFCNASRPSPLLTTDGYVSSCDNVLFGENPGIYSVMIYGKWNPSEGKIIYDKSKIDRLRHRIVDNIDGCNGCEVKYNCGGFCIAELLECSGDMYGKKEGVCETIRLMAKHMPLNDGIYPCGHP